MDVKVLRENRTCVTTRIYLSISASAPFKSFHNTCAIKGKKIDCTWENIINFQIRFKVAVSKRQVRACLYDQVQCNSPNVYESKFQRLKISGARTSAIYLLIYIIIQTARLYTSRNQTESFIALYKNIFYWNIHSFLQKNYFLLIHDTI